MTAGTLEAETAAATGQRPPAPKPPSMASPFFMMGSLATMVSALGLLMFTPPPFSYTACAILYAALVAVELRFGYRSPQSMLLLACYASYAIGARAAPEEAANLQPYAGVGIFAVLAALSGVLLAIGRPFTTFYSEGKGLKSLHYTTSLLWLAIYVLGLTASLLLMPDVLYVLVPLGFVAMGAVATVWMNLVWFGPAHTRQTDRMIGGFRFRQLGHDPETLDRFYEFYAQEVWGSVSRDPKARAKFSRAQILDVIRSTEQSVAYNTYRFHAYDGDTVVGSIAVTLDHPQFGLPVEKTMGITVDPLRRFGRIMQVGKLSIHEKYRFRQDILVGLLTCVIEVGLEHDVSFLINFAFRFRAAMYTKIGFKPLMLQGQEVFQYGSPMQPMALNLAALIMCGREESTSTESVARSLNYYLAERWFKRAALREGLLPPGRRAHALSVEQIDALTRPAAEASARRALRVRRAARLALLGYLGVTTVAALYAQALIATAEPGDGGAAVAQAPAPGAPLEAVAGWLSAVQAQEMRAALAGASADALKPRDAAVLRFALARVAGDLGTVEDARRRLEEQHAGNPDDAEILAYLGAADALLAREYPLPGVLRTYGVPGLARLMYVRRAVDRLDEAVERAPGNPVVRYVAGATRVGLPAVFGQAGKGERDLAALDGWITDPSLNPRFAGVTGDRSFTVQVYMTRALHALRNGSGDAARRDLRRVVALAPSTPFAVAAQRLGAPEDGHGR